MGKSCLERNRFISVYSLTTQPICEGREGMNSGKETEAVADKEAMEECCLVACSS